MMAIHDKDVTAEDRRPLVSHDVPDRCPDTDSPRSSKSFENTESETSSSRKSSDTILEISEKSKSEKSDDSPDYSSAVYKPTTESVELDDKKSSFLDCCCCCCKKMGSIWGDFRSATSTFSNRQCCILIALCLGTLTSSLSVCLFPPFYPKLAESKGASATMYGIVIGTNCLTAFIVTPIIGKNMEEIGVNFAFLSGMFGSGICCSLSGLLEYFPCGIKFNVLSIFIRILHATANALVITSTMAFVAGEFPHSVAFLFSLTRATMNLAQMIGPVLGGALHNVGGFKMPFFVLGSTQVFVTIICSFFLPQFQGKSRKDDGSEKKGIWSVLKVPGLWVSLVTFFFSTMSNGFLSITLEPRVLRPFNISPLAVGLLFGLKDGANCFASPVWGWLCDRINKIKSLIIIGSILASISFILLGPFPGLPINHTLLIVILSLILNGFGIGGQQVAGVISAMKDTVDAGFPDEPDTHAFVAGLWSSLSGAGRFISRAGSGFLVDKVGFRITSAVVTCLHLFILFVATSFECLAKPTQKVSDQKKRNRYPINVETTSPSEPMSSKSATVAVPVVREDLEGSFMIGSASSRKIKGEAFSYGQK